MRRVRWPALLCGLCLLGVTACGRSDGAQETGSPDDSGQLSGDTSPSAAADRCDEAPLEGTEIGVTDSKIVIQVSADVGSPLAPGLFQSNVDAMKAFAAHVNANGGVGCRQLEVQVWDSKLDAGETKNGLVNACTTAVALVGGNSLFNPDNGPLVDCADKAGARTGLPDVAALANDVNEQCNPTTYTIQSITEPCDTLSGRRELTSIVGPTNWLLENHPGLHGTFMVPGDLPTTVQSGAVQIAVQEQAGMVFDATPKVSGRAEQAAYSPLALGLTAAGSNYVYNGANDRAMITMRQEAQAQGVTGVDVWACHLGCYTKNLLAAGDTVEGTYLWFQFLPFEEADTNPEAAAFIDAVGADEADSNGAQAWQAGVLFQQVVDEIVADDGPNGITRAAILDRLAATKDFTANGWIGAKDLRGVSDCFVMMQVVGGAFTRVHPTEPGTLDCSPENVTTLTIDPTEAAKEIT